MLSGGLVALVSSAVRRAAKKNSIFTSLSSQLTNGDKLRFSPLLYRISASLSALAREGPSMCTVMVSRKESALAKYNPSMIWTSTRIRASSRANSVMLITWCLLTAGSTNHLGSSNGWRHGLSSTSGIRSRLSLQRVSSQRDGRA